MIKLPSKVGKNAKFHFDSKYYANFCTGENLQSATKQSGNERQ